MIIALRYSTATVVVLATAGLVALSSSVAASDTSQATARWTQITKAHSGARSNVGLARDKSHRLHVLWAGPGRAPYPSVLDTPITRTGAVGKAQPVLSGWVGLNPPTAATAKDGVIHVVVSGQRTSSNTDPFAGLNEVVGPGSWKLGAKAFGNTPITVASNADVHSAFLPSGQLVSVWQTAAALLFQVGVDPATTPQNVTPAGDPAANPVLAVDQRNGEAVVAYHGVASGSNYFRRLLPALGSPQAMPGAKADGTSIAARTGGGVYTAYSPDGSRVSLLRFDGGPKQVPVPKGARVLTAGLAAGPEGRLWVFYGDERRTYVTRTSKAVGGFEPVQTFPSPAGAAQYFRLDGEGSAGPLDLFASVTVNGTTKDGSYHRHVLPALSLRVSKADVAKRVRVTARVVDAGDPVAGARVTGLPGGVKKTDASGSVVVALPAGEGTLRVTASKPGYVQARATVSL